jgi:RNA polymerase sigma-70 factor (ECF subfamily)
MDTDSTLLQAAKKMNADALAKIFDRYANALYRYALCLCSDPYLADYIVGNVFAKLVNQFSVGNGPNTNLRSYLFEATYHFIVDEARYSQRRAPLDVVDAFPCQEQLALLLEAENRELFSRTLHVIRNELTDYQRHVVVLRYLEGFSLRETAAILGKSVNIVKAAQNRAIGNLRRALVMSQ